MSCEHVQERLLELPVARFDEIDHLAGCPRCRALADEIREAEAVIAADLDAFAEARPFDEAWAAALDTSTTKPRIRIMSSVLVALAAAAALLLSLAPPGGAEPASPCADLESLTEPALAGQLADDAVACLSDLADGGGPTDADASRLLLVHHWAADDLDAWRAAAVHHLEAVDAEDPDLAYKLAVQLYEDQDHAGVRRWAEAGLDHAALWPEAVRTTRRDMLLKLRAASSNALLRAAPDDAALRSQAVEDAVAWLAHARAEGLPTETAAALCAAAGGTDCAAE